METKLVPAGTVIFKKGDIERCMYDLTEGSVAIYADYGLPTEKKLTVLSAGKNRFLGEMGLIDAAPRSATAVAETDCRMLTIDVNNAKEYFYNSPETLLDVMRQLSDRTRALTDDYLEAAKTISESEDYRKKGQSIPERLIKKLHGFADIWRALSGKN